LEHGAAGLTQLTQDMAELFSEAIGDEDITELHSIEEKDSKNEGGTGLDNISGDFEDVEIQNTE